MDSSKFIYLGLFGVALYVAYEWFTSQCESPTSGFYGGSMCNMLIGTPVASAVAPVTTTTPATTATPVAATTTAVPSAAAGVVTSQTLAALQQAIQTAANSNSFIQAQSGQADAYQWDTLWNSAGGPALNVNAIFFPSGLNQGTANAPGMSSQGLPLMTLSAFLNAVQSSGVSFGVAGLGFLAVSRVPTWAIHGGW